MCILGVWLGGEDGPSVVVNNRDEFFSRPTARGSLTSKGISPESNSSLSESPPIWTYSPRDNDRGGSWIAADNLTARKGARFACVLNFHLWREPPPTKDDSRESQSTEPECGTKSRGLLVSEFADGECSAREYAEAIFTNRRNFRPFNLIVADSVDGWLISSSPRQTKPMSLEFHRWHLLANGFYDEKWPKASRLQAILDRVWSDFMSTAKEDAHKCLTEPKSNMLEFYSNESETSLPMKLPWNDKSVRGHSSMNRVPSLGENIPKRPLLSPSVATSITSLVEALFCALSDSQPLPDPLYGDACEGLKCLAAVNVSPVWICEKAFVPLTAPDSRYWRESKEGIWSTEWVNENYRPWSAGEALSPEEAKYIFGTRTRTVILSLPAGVDEPYRRVVIAERDFTLDLCKGTVGAPSTLVFHNLIGEHVEDAILSLQSGDLRPAE